MNKIFGVGIYCTAYTQVDGAEFAVGMMIDKTSEFKVKSTDLSTIVSLKIKDKKETGRKEGTMEITGL